MKHMKYLPFLIAAASYVPRVHAAEVVASAEPSTASLVLIGVALVALSLGRRGQKVIKISE